MRRKVLAAENHLRRLEDLVQELNDGPSGWGRPEIHPKLVQLIRAWQQSTEKWRTLVRAGKASGSPRDAIPRPVNIKVPEGCPTVLEMQENCRVLLSPQPQGERWHPAVIYGPKGRGWTSWELACSKFIPLILNPECHRLRGPCPNCGNFFITKTEREKRYCSRKCAHKGAAKASTRRRRAREHEGRVFLVVKAIEEWRRIPRRTGWIPWVLRTVPGISKTWLTRAINRNQIAAPI
jgi:hypothetical protein